MFTLPLKCYYRKGVGTQGHRVKVDIIVRTYISTYGQEMLFTQKVNPYKHPGFFFSFKKCTY